MSELKIEIPKSATNIVGHTDSGVDFLMPNDQWRDYVETYYPNNTLTPRLAKELDGSAPIWYYPVLRSGVKLTKWTTGGDIQYLDTSKHAYRFLSVTPDCEPDKAYVAWTLGDPE